MELIPILSLIILVATISTFMLSVGAYILYKIRERKGMEAQSPKPAAVPAELVTPVPLSADQREIKKETRQTNSAARYKTYKSGEQKEPMFTSGKQRSQGGPEMRPTFVSPSYSTSAEKSKGTAESGKPYKTSEFKGATGNKKFMRYTSNGYVEPDEDGKRSKGDNLKWR